MGLKPSDPYGISLCAFHHAEQHRIGEPAFERKYDIDMKKLAARFVQRSPQRRELEEAARMIAERVRA